MQTSGKLWGRSEVRETPKCWTCPWEKGTHRPYKGHTLRSQTRDPMRGGMQMGRWSEARGNTEMRKAKEPDGLRDDSHNAMCVMAQFSPRALQELNLLKKIDSLTKSWNCCPVCPLTVYWLVLVDTGYTQDKEGMVCPHQYLRKVPEQLCMPYAEFNTWLSHTQKQSTPHPRE